VPSGIIGMNEKMQAMNRTGPIILSHLFIGSAKVGTLNTPKSAPEKYGASRRTKEKTSNITPNESGRPENLKRLVRPVIRSHLHNSKAIR
jgi:hypothetical protein